MAETATLPAEAAKPPPALDEVMLAMDVVDTLRHNESIALEELGQDGRDDSLKARLRQIYESQGLAVSDRILEDGIRALKESRFSYTPSGSAGSRRLAWWWTKRGAAGKWLAAILIALGAWTGFGIWKDSEAKRQVEAARIELAQVLPQRLQKTADAALAEARTDDAKARIEDLRADGVAALGRSDASAARADIAALDRVREQLAQTYVLRIVSRSGEQSGIFRIPRVNDVARNYYIIVEAVTPDGKVLTMPITSEETRTTQNVSMWGIRVPQQTFDAVRRDKQDDGIVQDNILGRKSRGALNPTYTMPVLNGAITDWK